MYVLMFTMVCYELPLYPCSDSPTVRLEVCVFSFASLVSNSSTDEPPLKRITAIFGPWGSESVAEGAPITAGGNAHSRPGKVGSR